MWKLDKFNAEVVQANLKADFQRIAFKHHEEVTKLKVQQRDYVEKIAQELLMVRKLIVPTITQADESILNILEDEDDPAKFS